MTTPARLPDAASLETVLAGLDPTWFQPSPRRSGLCIRRGADR